MITVRWSEESVNDLIAIRAFIARDSEVYANRVVDQLIEAVEQLCLFPDSGREVPEKPGQSLRELIRAPYRIVYRSCGTETIEVVTVFHSARLIDLP